MKWLAVLLAAVVMAGCATPPPVVAPAGSVESGVLWRTGRFAVNVEELGGKQHAVQGGFTWRDAAREGLTLDLNSPLGAALARVEVAPDGSAVLIEANGTRTPADSADDLVARVLGSPIPVAGLRHWLRGQLPGAHEAQILQTDTQGRPTTFVQGGWRVQITEFDAIGPVRLQLQRNEPGNRNINARLVMTPSAAP